MRGLIGDLLNAGRTRAGTLPVAPEPTEVAALVERARATFLYGGRQHSVLIDLPPGLPRVMADRRRIVQVLNNLLSNAARHSPEAAPIEVSAARDGARVAISVTDRGRGVPPERPLNLFHNYADTVEGERAIAGTGLGLVICRGLVEAHGGRIRAESGGHGEGARFTFTVPVAGDAGQGGSSVPGPFPPSPAQHVPARVLVVDDDPQTLRYVREALTGAGYAALVDGRPGGAVSDDPQRETGPGPARPRAARHGRPRAYGQRAGARRPAGGLHLRLRRPPQALPLRRGEVCETRGGSPPRCVQFVCQKCAIFA